MCVAKLASIRLKLRPLKPHRPICVFGMLSFTQLLILINNKLDNHGSEQTKIISKYFKFSLEKIAFFFSSSQ